MSVLWLVFGWESRGNSATQGRVAAAPEGPKPLLGGNRGHARGGGLTKTGCSSRNQFSSAFARKSSIARSQPSKTQRADGRMNTVSSASRTSRRTVISAAQPNSRAPRRRTRDCGRAAPAIRSDRRSRGAPRPPRRDRRSRTASREPTSPGGRRRGASRCGARRVAGGRRTPSRRMPMPTIGGASSPRERLEAELEVGDQVGRLFDSHR